MMIQLPHNLFGEWPITGMVTRALRHGHLGQRWFLRTDKKEANIEQPVVAASGVDLTAGEVKELKACASFDNVRRLADLCPDKHILFTEGCQELGGRELSSVLHDWKLGERYSMNMIADMNSGCEEGGPNHVGNTCVAPIICNTKMDEILYQPSYWHLGHFSKYIRLGAQPLLCSSTRDALEVTAFLNPDGQVAVVVLNQSEEDIPFWFKVRHQRYTKAVEIMAPRRSIQTLLVEDGSRESWFSRLSRSFPFQLRLWISDLFR
eukprot:symbB.v1.2.027625.t1/scaffold2847.1/size68964/3